MAKNMNYGHDDSRDGLLVTIRGAVNPPLRKYLSVSKPESKLSEDQSFKQVQGNFIFIATSGPDASTCLVA